MDFRPGLRTWKLGADSVFPENLIGPASILKQGGLAVYPTETFYALGAVPTLTEAVMKIFEMKERSLDKPLPLIASDMQAVLSAVSEWPQTAELLARNFWPGPLTIVLPAALTLPHAVHAGTKKIAIRVSSHRIASMLAVAAGGLLVSTSANLAGFPPPCSPTEVSGQLLAGIDVFINGGNLPGGFPSTIVDVTTDQPVLIRAGMLDWEKIYRVLDAGSSA